MNKITQATWVQSDSITPPINVDWQEVVLPHIWSENIDTQGFYRSHWYKLSFPLSSPKSISEPLGIYLPSVNMNAEVWVNGERVGSGGSMVEPLARNWHRPLLFTVPAAFLFKENEMMIRVVAYANKFGALGEVYVAPSGELQSYYDQDYFMSVTINIVAAVLTIFIALAIFPVWFRRREKAYFWLMLACAFLAVASLNESVRIPPLSSLHWEALMHITISWVAICMMIYILHNCNYGMTWLKKSAIISGFCITIILALMPLQWFFPVASVGVAVAMVYGVVGVILMIYHWLMHKEKGGIWISICLIIFVTLAVHDLLVRYGLIGGFVRMWLNYSVILLLVMIAIMMVVRFLDALQSYEVLTSELEDRVEQAQDKLKKNYERIALLETEQAVLRERSRIYSDLHDDLGARLLSLVYQSKTPEQQSLAKAAMNKLRQIVSQQPVVNNLQFYEFVLTCRSECEERMDQAGFAFLWSQSSIPSNLLVSSERLNHMESVIREAISNAIKAPKASEISLKLKYRCGCVQIKIANNGDVQGCYAWKQGGGLQTMKTRTQELGGRITWGVDEGRDCLTTILFPVTKPT